MNDIKSLLIATTVLAIGGLGLYMYKSEDNELDYDDEFSESGSEIESDLDLNELEEEDLEELEYDDYETKKSKKGTKRNTKKKSGTRKKH
jgi:hypothetical protein